MTRLVQRSAASVPTGAIRSQVDARAEQTSEQAMKLVVKDVAAKAKGMIAETLFIVALECLCCDE